MRPIEIVEGCTLLNPLSPEERQELAASMQLRKADKGQIIWFGGEVQGYFCIVGSGFIKMSRPSMSGHEVTLELMGPGQVFGLMGVVEGKGCPLNATALTPAVYGYVPGQRILPIYRQNVAFKDTLLIRSIARFHEKLDLMARMASGRVDERIAAVLLLLAASYGKQTERGILLDVPLTRQEIGELAGTTTESAIRTLSAWQKQKWVATQQQRITLLKLDALEAVFGEA